MMQLIGLLLALAAIGYGFALARRFVRTRLRFVDTVHTPRASVLSGIGAALVALPVFLLLPLPFFGPMTAAAFGVSVGAGIRAGSKDARRAAGYIEGS